MCINVTQEVDARRLIYKIQFSMDKIDYELLNYTAKFKKLNMINCFKICLTFTGNFRLKAKIKIIC